MMRWHDGKCWLSPQLPERGLAAILVNIDWRRRTSVAVWIVSITATMAMFASLRTAWFTGDDWHYFALLRHIDSPTDVFTTNIGLSYFYRPITLFVFWLSESLFGINPVLHYGLNIALHVWVAAEIYGCSKLLTARPTLAAWIAGLFLVFPATSATVLWVSNRFDLMATAAMLCSLRLLWAWDSTEKKANKYLWLSFLMAVIALGSKETAFALVPAMVVAIAFVQQRSTHQKIMAVAAVFVLAVLALLIRFSVLGELTRSQSVIAQLTTVADGTAQWLLALPAALQTQRGLWVLFALGAAALLTHWFGSSNDARVSPAERTHTSMLLPLLVLLTGVVLAQSPVAASALSLADGGLATVSLRFYYAPLAILFVMATVAAARALHSSSHSLLVPTAVLVAVVACAIASSRQTQVWAENTATEQKQFVAAQEKYTKMMEQQRTVGSACIVQIEGENAVPADLDLKFKATLSSSDPRVNCVLISNPPQAQSITRITPCRTDAVLPARPTHTQVPAAVRSGTCTYFFLTR